MLYQVYNGSTYFFTKNLNDQNMFLSIQGLESKLISDST